MALQKINAAIILAEEYEQINNPVALAIVVSDRIADTFMYLPSAICVPDFIAHYRITRSQFNDAVEYLNQLGYKVFHTEEAEEA